MNDNEEIVINSIKLEFSTNKYSAKKNSIWHIILNNKNISKKDKYYFKYDCVSCNMSHIVATTQMLRKINKGSIRCDFCKNSDMEKCLMQSRFMKNNMIACPSNMVQPVEPIIKDNTSQDSCEQRNNTPTHSFLKIKNDSIRIFNSMDDDFKNNYYSFHLTNDDYMRISKNIISFQNGKYTDIDQIEYWPIYNSMNQMNYTSVLYCKNNNTVFKAHQPIMKCDNCMTTWRAKSIERFKNCYKIMCKDCLFVNKTFKIRQFKNINNELILYQSKLELKFINWCNNNNILLHNGPKLIYNFENKTRTYRVDFLIKSMSESHDILIEVKDNHIWHKNDIISGKWKAKEDAVHEAIKKGEYKEYYMITPKNWMEIIDKLNKI